MESLFIHTTKILYEIDDLRDRALKEEASLQVTEPMLESLHKMQEAWRVLKKELGESTPQSK